MGYEAKEWKKLKEYCGGYGKVLYTEYVFIARNAEKTAEPKPDGGEKFGKVEWVDFDAFLQLCRSESFGCLRAMRMEMYEALVDAKKYAQLKQAIFE